MKLHKSLMISFLVHTLAFGSAFGYAYFSGKMFAQTIDHITVSLVELGSVENRAKNRIKKQTAHAEHRARSSEGMIHATTLPHEPSRTTLTAEQEQHARDEHGADAEELPTDSPENKLAGGNFGMIPPEEWELIRSALERTRYYPRLARRRGIEGVVRLRFRIGNAGKAENVEIVKSSGFKMLDAASLQTVYRAGPLPPVKGWIEVPIGYVLK